MVVVVVKMVKNPTVSSVLPLSALPCIRDGHRYRQDPCS